MIARLPTWLGRLIYRIGYVVLRVGSAVLRPKTRGTKVLVVHGEEILLVRHTYGPDQWDMPGGFCRRGEEFVDAGRRELGEELGIDDASWTTLGILRRKRHGRREAVGILRAEVVVAGVRRIERAELKAAEWFPRDAMPDLRSEIIEEALDLERL